MPLYEYKCDQCNAVFEVMQRFSDAPLETHSQCGGRVRRLISVPALQFKGSGWYITDYARSGSHGGNGGNGDGAPKDGAAKSESAAKPGDTASKS